MIDEKLEVKDQTESRSIAYLIVAGVVAILLATLLLGTKSTFADAIHYTITYDSGVVENMPTDQDTKTLAETVPISATAPTRSGFNFLGWCSQVPTSSGGANLDICGGGTFIPNSDWTINQTSASNNLHLYAMWERKIYMQNVSEWKDTLLPSIGDETIAIDVRDEKQYYVAKLPDGNIWMTQNLDHNIDSSYNYNSTNTDVPANWSDTLTSTYATGTTTWNFSATAPESYDPGDRCWNGTLDSNWSTNLDTGTTACSSITTTPDHYHIGNYYNWTASVAMQNSSSYTADNTDVNQSICPAGWMLPKSGTVQTGSGSFYDLINGRYTSGTSGNIHSSPVYFVYGGDWLGSSSYVSSYGSYWSSVVVTPNYSYDLDFSVDGGKGNTLHLQDGSARNGGGLVRCVAR